MMVEVTKSMHRIFGFVFYERRTTNGSRKRDRRRLIDAEARSHRPECPVAEGG